MRFLSTRAAALLVCVTAALSVVPVQKADAEMCVRYVRALTDFRIRGDAWTWWEHAAGQYARGIRPRVGSVLVFRKTSTLPYGHVAVVSGLVDARTIRVDHSWEDAQLHRGMKVIDVSSRNDWSAVRVWHDPSHSLGVHVYASYGFIHSEGASASRRNAMETASLASPSNDDDSEEMTFAAASSHASISDDDDDDARQPVAQTPRSRATQQVAAASVQVAEKSFRPTTPVRSTTQVVAGLAPELRLIRPQHKPITAAALVMTATNTQKSVQTVATAAVVPPGRKPATSLPLLAKQNVEHEQNSVENTSGSALRLASLTLPSRKPQSAAPRIQTAALHSEEVFSTGVSPRRKPARPNISVAELVNED
ncbi:exported hypothetical protein [Azospirillaceae bacterium]